VTITGTVAEAPARFSAIEIAVSAEGVERPLLEKLVTIADRGCLVANTLRAAVDLTIRIN
jgi:putative redox protein